MFSLSNSIRLTTELLTKMSTVQQFGAQEWFIKRVAVPHAVASTIDPSLSLKKYVLPPMLCMYWASL